MRRERGSFAERLEFWGRKTIKRWSRRGKPAVGLWASHLLYVLDRQSDRRAEAENMASLAAAVGIPRKFLSRAVAATNGLVSFLPGPPVRLVLHRKRLLRGKNAVDKIRGRIPRSLRAWLLDEDGHRCGRCGKKFSPDELEIDHLVPLALRGLTSPATGSLCAGPTTAKSGRAFSMASSATIAESEYGDQSESVSATGSSGLTSTGASARTDGVTRRFWREATHNRRRTSRSTRRPTSLALRARSVTAGQRAR